MNTKPFQIWTPKFGIHMVGIQIPLYYIVVNTITIWKQLTLDVGCFINRTQNNFRLTVASIWISTLKKVVCTLTFVVQMFRLNHNHKVKSLRYYIMQIRQCGKKNWYKLVVVGSTKNKTRWTDVKVYSLFESQWTTEVKNTEHAWRKPMIGFCIHIGVFF